jgi:hypothetical protein
MTTRLWKRVGFGVLAFLLVYFVVAYLVLPFGWIRYEKRHPTLDTVPRTTRTIADIPGDPLNVALVGTEREVKTLLLNAGYYPADPLTLRSCLEIAEASVLKRTYDDAPVSNLYLFGRKEDLAFEQPVGDNPRKRHHVRFWRAEATAADGRPVWVGATTYDERVGVSHTTGQITHHIAADIDSERDHLFHELEKTGDLAEVYVIHGFHTVLEGRNGGGDPWHTDGDVFVGMIKPEIKSKL